MTFHIPWSYCVSKRDKTEYYRGTPRRSAKWKAALRAISLIASSQCERGHKPFEGPVHVHFDFVFPTKRQKDVHNYTEAVFDGLEGVAYLNDQQAVEWSGKLIGFSKEKAGVTVVITPVEGSAREQLQQELRLP